MKLIKLFITLLFLLFLIIPFKSFSNAISDFDSIRTNDKPGYIENTRKRETDLKNLPNHKSPFRRNLPTFLSAKMSGGKVYETKDFIRGENAIPFYQAYTLKFGISSIGDTWQDIAYGMPYYGIGLYTADFGRKKDIGVPISLYLLQGATLFDFGPRFMLNYEWNLGVAAGWKPYDPVSNPENICIGTDINVHVGLSLYMKFIASHHLDLNLGVDVTHFSNGASKMPNAGLNMASVYVEAVYNFNRKKTIKQYNPDLRPPLYEPHYVSEILVNISSRADKINNTGTGLPTPYIDKKFKVLGVNYAFLRVPNYRYRYGISTDFVYDESVGITARRITNEADGKTYDIVKKGKLGDRFGLGFSARGEIVLPGYSMFANMGYNVVHKNPRDYRFYQVIGAKLYLKENFFGTFGIRANRFSRAQFLFWSLGYTIDHSPIEKRRSRGK